jgi:magnesium-transporting ATPase (P-type)
MVTNAPARAVAAPARGLTGAEAQARLARDGPNLLPQKPPPSLARRILAQLIHFFAVMLWVAGVLAIIAGMLELGIAIFVVILLNGAFAFLQEYRADRAAEKLRELLPRRVMVMRDGHPLEIDAAEVVVGDLVWLREGDRVSADLELGEAHGLAVNTAALTGESVPARPGPGEWVFAGTFVVEGEGKGEVRATAGRTRLASIVLLSRAEHRPPSPLARELTRIVRVIALVASGTGLFFMLIAALVGIRLSDAFLFAIGVTVALVPEGLLPTVTLSLAMGAQRMAARHALVRRLESVETLGSTTFIATDKTGTLTMNQMAVVDAWTPDGGARIAGQGYEPQAGIDADQQALPALQALARALARASNGRAVLRDGRWTAQGDPLEAALDVFGRRLGFDRAADEQAHPPGRKFPFDPRRRRMSVVAGEELLVKGAPESVLPRCGVIEGAAVAFERMAERGLRVIAAARRPAGGLSEGAEADAAETGLKLLGLVGIEDPPRPEVAEAIAGCRRAGIRVAMVTGDHPATARAIARETGLLGPEELVVEGRDLPEDEQVLGALIDRDGVVISRVTPEEKLRIARALERRGHVLAMTGDGVNDAPALQRAAIGIAMGRSGTDVAREAADLVLLDDNFATIVAAIEQGRTTFANTRRFLTYHLTDNVAELTPFVLWALSGGRFPLALGVLQVLALDIGTDVLPALALGAEPPSPRTLRKPPHARHLLDRGVLFRAFGLLGPVESLIEMLAFLAVLWMAGWRPGGAFPGPSVLLAASGAAFTAVVLGQMANAFACRSTSVWPGKLGWGTNRFLLYAVASELVLLLFFLHFPPLAQVLGQAPPDGVGLLVALLALPAVLAADALEKRWRAARRRLAP